MTFVNPGGHAVAYVGLGSNVDGPIARVRSAVQALGALPDTALERCSSLYRSLPVGRTDQPDFINAVCRLATRMSPEDLLDGLLAIERAHGRIRGAEQGGPRTLDLDLLLYDDTVCDGVGLVLPHPRLHERAFVLYPLLELDPEIAIPGRGRASDLAAACTDQTVERLAGT